MTTEQQWWQPSGPPFYAEPAKDCEVCYRLLPIHLLIAVQGIAYQTYTRITPWYVCLDCVEKICAAFQAKKDA